MKVIVRQHLSQAHGGQMAMALSRSTLRVSSLSHTTASSTQAAWGAQRSDLMAGAPLQRTLQTSGANASHQESNHPSKTVSSLNGRPGRVAIQRMAHALLWPSIQHALGRLSGSVPFSFQPSMVANPVPFSQSCANKW